MFSIFGRQLAEKGRIDYREIGYVMVILGVCLCVSLTGVQIRDIIEINGAVVGFFFIYFLPLVMHIECRYVVGIRRWFGRRFMGSN